MLTNLKSSLKSFGAALIYAGIDQCCVCLHSWQLPTPLHEQKDALRGAHMPCCGACGHQGCECSRGKLYAPGLHSLVQGEHLLQPSSLQQLQSRGLNKSYADMLISFEDPAETNLEQIYSE